MGVLVLAGSHIGLTLLFLLVVGSHLTGCYLAVGFVRCECELFSAGVRGSQGGYVNCFLERQLNVLRSFMKFLGTLRKCLRKPSIAGVYLSSGFENRSETSGFNSVLVALLRDVSVNLLVTLTRATLSPHQHVERQVGVKFILCNVAGDGDGINRWR
ncbi:hypothetical protein Pan241w_41950 [Gimesia alba]|uniref:Uncharacterized protein n=1 Tax=Gimesia alba TaxID=2527973 RepID=A0A517RJP7_9PLAN|nr:hypothetical protein Pan241w_41950 [Gimesia alba]